MIVEINNNNNSSSSSNSNSNSNNSSISNISELFIKIWSNRYLKNKIISSIENLNFEDLCKNDNLMYLGNKKKFGEIRTLGFLVKRKLWKELKEMIKNEEYLVITEKSVTKFIKYCKDKELFLMVLIKKKKEIECLVNVYRLLIDHSLLWQLECVFKELPKEYQYEHYNMLDSAIRIGSFEIIKFVYTNITKEFNQDRAVYNCFHGNNIHSIPETTLNFLKENCNFEIPVCSESNQFKVSWYDTKSKITSNQLKRELYEKNYIHDRVILVEPYDSLIDVNSLQLELELLYRSNPTWRKPDGLLERVLTNDQLIEIYYNKILLENVYTSTNLSHSISKRIKVFSHYIFNFKRSRDLQLFQPLFNIPINEPPRYLVVYSIKMFDLNLLKLVLQNPTLSFYDQVSVNEFFSIKEKLDLLDSSPITFNLMEYIEQFFSDPIISQSNHVNSFKTLALVSIIQLYPIETIIEIFQLINQLIQQYGPQSRPDNLFLNHRLINTFNKDVNQLKQLQVYLDQNYHLLVNEPPNISIKVHNEPAIVDLHISQRKLSDILFIQKNNDLLSNYEKELLKNNIPQFLKILNKLKSSSPSSTFIPTFNQYIIKSVAYFSNLDIVKILIQDFNSFNSNDIKLLLTASYQKGNYEITNYLLEFIINNNNLQLIDSFNKIIIGKSPSSCPFSKGDTQVIQRMLNNQSFKNSFSNLSNYASIIQRLLICGNLNSYLVLLDLNLIPSLESLNGNSNNNQFTIPFSLFSALVSNNRVGVLNYFLKLNQIQVDHVVQLFNNDNLYAYRLNRECYLFLKFHFGHILENDNNLLNNIPNQNQCNIM